MKMRGQPCGRKCFMRGLSYNCRVTWNARNTKVFYDMPCSSSAGLGAVFNRSGLHQSVDRIDNFGRCRRTGTDTSGYRHSISRQATSSGLCRYHPL